MQHLYRMDVADCMTIQECAYWLAFGRLSEASVVEGGMVDERRSVEAILDRGCSPVQVELFFERMSLQRLLPNLDYEEYFRNYLECLGESPEYLDGWHRKVAESLPIDGTEEQRVAIKKHNDEHEKEMDAAIWFEGASRPMRNMLERAQAEVFLALADGRIDGWGVFTPAEIDEPEEDVEPTLLVKVPTDDWACSKIDWDNPSLTTQDGEYLAVTVDTASFLALFPQPKITGTPVSGLLFGETLLIPDGDSQPEIPKSMAANRGAPTAVEKLFRDALEQEFGALKSAGKLPDKGEAQVALVLEFVKARLGGEVSRTTAQRYIELINRPKSGRAVPKAARKSAQN